MVTTHADSFHGPVPVTDHLTESEIDTECEKNMGVAICRMFRDLDPETVPAVLVRGQGPFCRGTDAAAAAHHAGLPDRWGEWHISP
jgi:L-ribulose-5-phosphate 4-epimerase